MTGLRGGTVLPRSETARGGMVPGLSAFPLRELVGWGGLERQGDGSYRLGRRLWLLGTAAPCVHRIHQAAVEALHELRTVTGLGAQLAVLDGTEAVVLAAFGRSAGADGGDRLPLYASAVGKMLLAHASPRVLEAVVQGGLTRLTPYTLDTPGRLAEQPRQARRTGIASAYEELRLGRAALAVPVTDRAGAVVAAIGLTAASRVSLPAHLGALKRAAEETSENLSVTFAG